MAFKAKAISGSQFTISTRAKLAHGARFISSSRAGRIRRERIRMPGKSQTKKIPRSSGVYQIRCNANGKFYIGSAVNMPVRWAEHKRKLQRGVHKNHRLQQAWNKYCEESFEFTVMEYVTPAFLLRVEQEWIDKSQCTDRKIGFNIYPIAGSPGDTFAQVWEGFIDPDGNEITIFNLQKFCREHGLHPVRMHQLKNGQRKSHKGWTWREE